MTTTTKTRSPKGPSMGFKSKQAPGDATVEARVGGAFLGRRDEFTNAADELWPVAEAITLHQQAVKSTANFARRFEEIPPEQRALNLPKLADKGVASLKLVTGNTAARRALDEADARFASEIHEELREVRGMGQPQFAAAQVRDYLRSLSEGKRRKALSEALDDIEATRAILAAPAMASGLDRAALERFEHLAVEKFMPTVARGRRAVAEARTLYEGARKVAIELISETAGLKESKDGWRPVWEIGDDS